MQTLVDTHAHLADSDFDADLADVLDRAKSVGVGRIVAVSETLDDALKNLRLAEMYDAILPAAGLYPTYLDFDKAEAMIDLIRNNADKIVAIGEVGLDYWKIKEPEERDIQHKIFESFIKLSIELNIPLNVHARSAGRHAIAKLIELGAKKVQMHAFDGKASTALPGIEAGFFFSIPASVMRSRQKQKLVKRLPLECLLLETDSPVLCPEPTVRNEPANLITALEEVARLKDIQIEELKVIIANNFHRLYDITL